MSQEELASKVGVTGKSTVSNWENNVSEPSLEILKKISDLVKASLDDLISTDLEKKRRIVRDGGVRYFAIEDAEEINIKPFIEMPLMADVPASAKLNEIDFYDYPEYFRVEIDNRNHFVLRVKEEYGYSMSPAISPGDFVVCHSNPKIIKDEDLVVVRFDETRGAIKKIVRNKKHKVVTLYSTNTAEPPITIGEDQVKQIFKITHIIKK